MIVESKVVINQKQFDILSNLGPKAIREFGKALDIVGMERTKMIKEKLNGSVLNRDSGLLINSIGWKKHGTGLDKAIEYGPIMRVVKYAAIHEFGGNIPDRHAKPGKAMIIPLKGMKIKVRSQKGKGNIVKVLGSGGKWKKAKAGAFQYKGEWRARAGMRKVMLKAKMTKHVSADFLFRTFAKGFRMKKRSYLISTAYEHHFKTIRIMDQAMKNVIAGAA